MSPRTIAFGDVHGDSRSLKVLLDRIVPEKNDRLVFCGDLIDRGLDSKGVIEILIELSSRCEIILIRGNHEELCLEAHDQDPPDLSKWLSIGGQSTLDSYETGIMPKSHLQLLEKSVDFFETDSCIFLHANFNNGYKLEETPSRILRWEFLDVENPERIPKHYSGKTVILGHSTVGDNALDLGHLIALDTGAGMDEGWLTCFDLAENVFHAANEFGVYRSYARKSP